MTYRISRSGETVRAEFEGFLTFHDHQEAEQLMDAVSRELMRNKTNRVVFELGKVEALDSHWLGVFIRILRRVREADAVLVLEKAQPDVRRLFSVIELDRVLEVAD